MTVGSGFTGKKCPLCGAVRLDPAQPCTHCVPTATTIRWSPGAHAPISEKELATLDGKHIRVEKDGEIIEGTIQNIRIEGSSYVMEVVS